MSLPASGYLSDAARTNAEMKVALEDQRDVIEVAGGAADVLWVDPEAPTDSTIELWLDTDEPSGFDLTIPVPIAQGGTGADDAAEARTNLDVFSKGEIQGGVTLSPVKIGTLDSPQVVRAYADCVTSNGGMYDSYGVSGSSRVGVGIFAIAWLTAFTTALYSVACVSLDTIPILFRVERFTYGANVYCYNYLGQTVECRFSIMVCGKT